MGISEKLKELANDMQLDEQKADNGNASAATRLRARLMEVKKFCDKSRKDVQAAKIAVK